MTIRLRIATGSLLTLFLCAGIMPVASAADITTPACLTQTYNALAHEQRVYRSVVFGQKKASDLPVGSILFDNTGTGWIKADTNQWKTTVQSQVLGDDQMDNTKDTPTRRGIFEQKRTPTSDMIPSLLQSLRALQCHLRAVCDAEAQSEDPANKGKSTVTVQPDGCIQMQLPLMTACSTDQQSPAAITPGNCAQAADALWQQEISLLKLTVAYDGAYRSIAQFSGMFDGFLSEFRFPLLNPLWQTVRVIGGLKNIPCFLSQCEE